MPQSGQQTITTNILHNISKNKDNQTMKFDQLIGYNIRNIFLKKSYIKCGRKPTIMNKIFETSSSFHVKKRNLETV